MLKTRVSLLLLVIAAPTIRAQSVFAADTGLSAASLKVGFPGAFAAAAASDAYYLTAGQPIARGSGQIRDAMSGDITTPRKVTFQPVSGGISSDGGLGYTYGYFDAPDEAPNRAHGKYINVWRQTPAGWRLAASVLSIDPGVIAPVTHDPPRAVAPAQASGRRGGGLAAMEEAKHTDSQFSEHAAGTSIADAFFTFAAPDAASLAGEPVIQAGRPAIRAIYEHLPNGTRLVWGPVGAGAAESGDLAFTVGEATLSYPDPAGAATRTFYSKYLTVWRREPAGDWRYVVDGGNRRPGP